METTPLLESHDLATLGQVIAHHRLRKGLSQAELGSRLKVSGGAVGNWERGGRIAEDHWPAIKEILEIGEVPEHLVAAQVGRRSRRHYGRVADSYVETVHNAIDAMPSKLEQANIPVASVRDVQMKNTHGRVIRHSAHVNAVRLPRRDSKNQPRYPNEYSTFRANFMAELFNALPEQYRDNLDVNVDINGNEYSYAYYSDKVVLQIDLYAFMPPPEGEQDRYNLRPRAAFTSVSTYGNLWRLAIANKVLGNNVATAYASCATVSSLNSRMFQRTLVEAGLMNIRLILADSASSLAEAIVSIETGHSDEEWDTLDRDEHL